jgi:F-type H+-transporting ATPase subunit delta
MTLSAVATRYANALADVVTASASPLRPEAAVAELRSVEAALQASVELQNALISPAVPGNRKRTVVGRIADALGLSRISRNFLYVLIDHRRTGSLSEVIQSLELIVDARLGFAHAELTSASELSQPQRLALTGELERLTGKRLRMRYAVDQSLIGGVIARIGSTVYDGSVRGQLSSMGRRLGAESYS